MGWLGKIVAGINSLLHHQRLDGQHMRIGVEIILDSLSVIRIGATRPVAIRLDIE
jgi:hypothetical protein